MNNKKILIVSNWLASYRVPLYELMIKEFGKENMHFLWLHVKNKNEIKQMSKLIYENSYFSSKFIKMPFFNFKFSLFFIKALIKLKYDYIISLPSVYPEVWFEYLISKVIRKKKIILWDEEFEWKKSWKRKLIMPITKHINRHVDYILVPTRKHKEWQLKQGVDKDKIILFPNVTNLNKKMVDTKKVEELKKKYNLKEKKVIMYVGRLIKLKGVNYLIDAYKLLINKHQKLKDKTRLLIIGNGILRKELEYKAKNIKNNVLFLGKIKNSELPNFYSLANIGVIPSINIKGMADSAPLVFNEFLVFNNLVLFSNMVGTGYHFDNELYIKFYFKEKNTKNIYNKLEQSLKLKKQKKIVIQKKINKLIKKINNIRQNCSKLKKIIKDQ